MSAMDSKKSQVLVNKQHHHQQMKKDLQKMYEAVDFVTEMHVNNSLQEILAENRIKPL